MPIYKQKDGSYLIQVNFKDHDGKYKKLSARRKDIKNKGDALLVENELKKKAQELSFSSTANTSKLLKVSETADEFLDYIKSEVRKVTFRHKKQIINDYVINYFKDAYIFVFEKQKTFLLWRNYIDNYVSLRTKAKLSISAKNGIIKDFATYVKFLVKYYDLDDKAFKTLEKFRHVDEFDLVKIHYWTLEEFEKVNEFIPDRTYKQQCTKTLINTLFFTGMRKSEAYALTWQDLIKYEDHYFFNIKKSLSQKVLTDGEYTITGTKNRSSTRRIMLTQYVVKLIQKLRERALDALDDQCVDTFIFGGFSPISDTQLSDTLNRAADEAGITRIKVHDLRHSFITLLINNDVNIKTISALVGHANTKMTWDVYGHLYPEKENQAISKLDEILEDE